MDTHEYLARHRTTERTYPKPSAVGAPPSASSHSHTFFIFIDIIIYIMKHNHFLLSLSFTFLMFLPSSTFSRPRHGNRVSLRWSGLWAPGRAMAEPAPVHFRHGATAMGSHKCCILWAYGRAYHRAYGRAYGRANLGVWNPRSSVPRSNEAGAIKLYSREHSL